jgi:hypothetical protein
VDNTLKNMNGKIIKLKLRHFHKSHSYKHVNKGLLYLQLSQYTNEPLAGLPGLDSWQCKIFLFSTVFRPTLVPTQPPIQWAMGKGDLSPVVKWQGHEAEHSPQYQERWSYTSTVLN